jgi:hypothetical protein
LFIFLTILLFSDVHKQINLIIEERAGSHAPELRRVAEGVIGVGGRISDAYSEGSELVEEVWKRCTFLLISLIYFLPSFASR